MTGCLFHSAWAPGMKSGAAAKVSNKGQVTFADNVCSLPACFGPDKEKNYCTTTAICQLASLEDYAAATCPTCDGYTCKEEEVCVMEEEKPVCKLLQVGCDDNKKCGSYGDCEPVGANDYTCVCKDGYQLFADKLKQVKTCIKKNTIWTIVEGEVISSEEAESIAECPKGTKVMRCMTYGVPTASDGVLILEEGNVCSAKTSRNSPHSIQAIAYCGSVTTMKDPCSEFEIATTEYRYSTDTSPRRVCPPGYDLSSCTFYSPWTEFMTATAKSNLDSIGAVKTVDGVCSVPDCAEGENWCRLTVICQKLTGDAYMKEACPTCQEMRCDDDEECVMGGNNLPQCVEVIVGGCEENPEKCGPGVCQPVNVTEYTCVCDGGYNFNGETCTDVNECSEMPCGNGACDNIPGDYICTCMNGYEVVNGRCADIDECGAAQNPCNEELYTCSNIEGSHVCDCHEAFVQQDDGSCACDVGYSPHNKECVDIDECADSPCGHQEECQNSNGGFTCSCKAGFAEDDAGTCIVEEVWGECAVTPDKEHISALRNTKVTVWLDGIKNKVFANYATVKWTKDGEIFDPTVDGKDILVKGFEIQSVQPQDEGIYKAEITLDKPGDKQRCSTSLSITLAEGSANVAIENRGNLADDQEAGKSFWIICDLEVVNVKMENPNDPNNVDWYKVTPGESPVKLTEETHGERYEFNKKKGTYRLKFLSPTEAESGTYRCQFEKDDLMTSTDVTIKIF